jgi:hypothetical protein
VADGTMTQEQADWMLEEMTEHLAWQLENGGLGGYGGGCGMRGGGWNPQDGMRGYRGGGWSPQGGMRGYRGGRGMRGGTWGNSTAAPRFRTNAL